MQLGCYGSSLAHSPESEYCQKCEAFKPCGEIVADRYPALIGYLDKFADSKGNSRAIPYLTEADKKARKKQARDEKIITLYGSLQNHRKLLKRIDGYAKRILRKLEKHNENPWDVSIETLEIIVPKAGLILNELSYRRLSLDDMVHLLMHRFSLSDASARRDAQSIKSLFVAVGKARMINNRLEKC